jgi:carboxylate-amine ligase
VTQNFGATPPLTLGVEEELLVVDAQAHALSHTAVELLDAVGDPGAIGPDTYAALVELAAPPSPTAAEAVSVLRGLRARVRDAGGTLLGSGIHPDGAWGDVVHHPAERYAEIHRQLRGLLRRTPTAALHVHVSAPDAETAVRMFSGLRRWLPLLQALAANSPFWFGEDSGLASARAQLFRGYPRAEIPPGAGSWDEHATHVADLVAAADAPDYTFLWQDIRTHPRLGTVEVRAMDAQSDLESVEALASLVQGLAGVEAESTDAPASGPLHESSFRAARDGLAATLWHDERWWTVPELARHAVGVAGVDGADIERLLSLGGGADRRRASFARGGMATLLADAVAETAGS